MRPNGNLHWEKAEVRGTSIVTIPAYGYLRGLEIRFNRPIENMDAARRMRVIVEPLDHLQGELFEVVAIFESCDP